MAKTIRMDHDSIYWLTHDDQLFRNFLIDMDGMVREHEGVDWVFDATRIASVEDNTTRLADIQVSENSQSSGSPGTDSAGTRKRKSSEQDHEAVPRRLVLPQRGATHEYCPSAPNQAHLSTPAIEEFTIGWICALPFEGAAAVAMLDEKFPPLPRGQHTSTMFTLGRIGPHKVVIACLPAGQYGTSPASVVSSEIRHRFPGITMGFLVGIGGGVPTEQDVRLGDVVVSQPASEYGGIVQYDLGKAEAGGKFRRTGHLNNPPGFLLSVLTEVQMNHRTDRENPKTYPNHMQRFWLREDMKEYRKPQDKEDILFCQECPHHPWRPKCLNCNQVVDRPERPKDFSTVKIHYGTIASGNQVIKDAHKRDKIVRDLGGQILCFEMEAAGLVNQFPCLVVRGISDYCDPHKNDAWQDYAAGNAAAFTRELLLTIPPTQVVK